MDQTTAILSFLKAVWGRQPDGFNFLSAKNWDTGEWSEYPLTSFPSEDDLSPLTTDLYFAPCVFTDPRRLRAHATSGRWLYADLDEVTPQACTEQGFAPTLAWMTSPNRYQALWLLTEALAPQRLERFNRRLTYLLGADKGGWSLTKVLRVPGSTSTKHGKPHLVRLVTRNPTTSYTPADLLQRLPRSLDTSSSHTSTPPPSKIPAFSTTMRRCRSALSIRAKQLIRTKTVLESDDRSARLWELENLLLSNGLSPIQVLSIVQATVWNKHRGKRDEVDILWREIHKAATSSTPPVRNAKEVAKHTRTNGLLPNTLTYDDFMAREWPKPSWLIDGVWTEGAYGILAGEYKAFKTMLLLDLALSVASGHPFTGTHQVSSTGPVCYIHEEGRPWSIHERLGRIAHWKGLTDRFDPTDESLTFDGRSLPIYITSLARLSLTDPEHLRAIAHHVAKVRPKLVIFETFYLLAGGVSETAIEEVAPILEFLAGLSHEYGTAVIISHHFHKSRDDRRFLDRVSGSNIFGRWYESGLFVERIGDETENKIALLASHRDGATTRDHLRLVWNSDDETSYMVEHLDEADLDGAADTIIDLATDGSDRPNNSQRAQALLANLTEPISLVDLKTQVGISRTDKVAHIARSMGLAIQTKGGIRYVIPK